MNAEANAIIERIDRTTSKEDQIKNYQAYLRAEGLLDEEYIQDPKVVWDLIKMEKKECMWK
jgi:hypothetical protein